MKPLILDGDHLTLDDLIRSHQPGAPVKLSPGAKQKVKQARKIIEQAVRDQRTVYGVTTGFGALSQVVIPRDKACELQKNILLSHSAGVGDPLPDAIVRLVMTLMANTKAKGYSGIRLSTLERLLELHAKGITPEVPEQGSVGASGDLAPLAHLSLVLIGRGRARFNGKWMSGKSALKKAGVEPVQLMEGEGLALVNGTQVMTAIGAWTLDQAQSLATLFDISAAMSLEVLLGTRTQFDARIHKIRPHPGQAASAGNMRALTRASEIISSHKDCNRVQDAYSLRCAPQVHGASRDVFRHVQGVLETEMNSATENPLVFPDGRILSGGNFHGQPVAMAMDSLTVALAELGSIAERRIERMVNPNLSGLPSFLIQDGGVHSGFMIAQYTAAALVSENKVLAHPASVDSIPTSANKEDHVSMGTIAARKAKTVLGNVKNVLAIELLCGAQALDLFTNLKPGLGTRAVYREIRKQVPTLKRDREIAPDIQAVVKMIDEGQLTRAAQDATGTLL